MQDGPAAAHRLAKQIAVRRGVNKAHAIAVDGAEKHDQAGEFKQRLAFGQRSGAKLQAGRVLKHDQQGDFALLDEFFPIRIAQAGGDIPVDVADVVAKFVFDDLVELHAAAAKGRAIFTAQHGLNRVAHAPFEAAQERHGRGRLKG